VQLARANRSGDADEIKRLSKAYDEASKSADTLAKELRDIDTAGGNFTSNIGNYKSALEDFKGALLSGDTQGLKNSFDAITGSIKGMITQSLAFIATPIGAAITALVGIGAAAKAVFDFNEGVKESNTLLKSLGVSSGEISQVRTELEATAQTYKKSFDDIAKTADSLASSYGISISEANDIIAKGLAQGGAGNQDFLNQISEYDVQFEKLGFTAEESLALINKGFQEGVFNDKLPDAIKEVGLSLEEGTKAAQDALTNAFGKAFSDNLFKSVQDGSLSTKDALIQIGNEADKVGLNLQQQGQLAADIFKGAGEDAGGALKVIDLLRQSQVKGLSETEQAYEDLRLANERYNAVQSELFEIENFGSVWANIKAKALDFFVDILEYVADLKSQLQPLIDLVAVNMVKSWEVVKIGVKSAFVAIKSAISSIEFAFNILIDLPRIIGNSFIKMKNIIIDSIKSIISGVSPLLNVLGADVDKLNKKIDGLKGKTVKRTENFITTTSKTSSNNENETSKADAEAKAEADRIKSRAEANKKSADENSKRLADAQKEKEDAQKRVEEAQKKEIESLQKFTDEKVKLANAELNAYIEKNKSILENEKYLTQELLKQENERLKNIQKARLDQEKLEFDTQNKILNDKINAYGDESKLNQTQKNERETLKLQQQQLELQYNSDVAKINEDTQKQITANETRYSNERIEAEKVRKAIQYQTELLYLEAKGASEQEIKLAQLDQQKEIEVTKLIETADEKTRIGIEKRLQEDALITEEQALKDELKAELQLEKDENEKIRVQTQLEALTNLERNNAKAKKQIDDEAIKSKVQSYGKMFGDIAGLFGEETAVAKAAGIAQAGINTYLGVTNVLADKTIPTLIKPVFVATTIATGLQSVAKISGIKGFADGGLISGGVEISRSNGDNRLITAKDGEVVLNERQQRALGGSNVFKSIGVPGFATGGVVGSPISSLSNIQNQFTSQLNSDLLAETLKNAVMEGSAVGTATGSQRGISDLSENNIIASNSNF
jgi:hypothetical protein